MTPMPKLDNDTFLLAFVAVTGLAVLLQAFILLAIFITVRKAARSIREEAEDLRSSLMPVIYNTRDLLTYSREVLTQTKELVANVSPKIEAAATDLAEITHGLRVQSAEIQLSALEILDRVRRQSSRLDAMFTSLLDGIDRAGGFVAEVVSKPVRQISALLASVKAVVETLGRPETEGQPTHASDSQFPADKDMFV